MSLDTFIFKNHSTIVLKIRLPQKTSKSYRYRYEKYLRDIMQAYLKKNHNSYLAEWKIRITESYDNIYGQYLQIKTQIPNHKNQHKELWIEFT